MERSFSDVSHLLQSGNLLPLAFLGDGLHTFYVRSRAIQNPDQTLLGYHSLAAKHCKASAQARALEEILPMLSVEEKDIVRRVRNCKPKHQAKNATSKDYTYATAFEGLVGYLYLFADHTRLYKVLEAAYDFIEKTDKKGAKNEN